ncbi:hypothetical protein [Streptomyces canus]|uniref:hypothetical protein n=1 Tax=Streptomyces canus TaxID=58343 RepID=UPI002E36FC84|nr:hypothetical protein [Streptomyces canus]
MTEDERPSGPGVHYRWRAPRPLGYGQADSMALFVAAPLLTAAALSLAGVVGGADTQFRWPGPTLLLLVVASLTLIASIQLSYHARLFLYSHDDLVSWLSSEYVDSHKIPLWKKQKEDQQRWQKYNKPAVVCFNAGTVLLGLGIAAALVPPDGGRQALWRWTAAVVVLVATVADGVWVTYLQLRVAEPPSALLRTLRRVTRRS